MSIDLSGVKAGEYGSYKIPYKSVIMEKEVELIIPTEGGEVEDWQIELANEFCNKETELKNDFYEAILAHYIEESVDLREQFGNSYAHLVPEINSVDELKKLVTPTGICIGELEPSEKAIGFLFECTWEEEHGLGVLLKNWKVEEVSHQDVAFTI